jgi:hypothetical protein
MNKWKLAATQEEAKKTVVFSGGASNVVDSQGNLVRNTERDLNNNWITEQGVFLYDPQVHPDTHGREYDYDIDHKLEMTARKAARIKIYEVSPRTFGGVTSLEIAVDEFHVDQPAIIFFSDGNQQKDVIPLHSAEGYPIFVPYIVTHNQNAIQAHYHELVKNANRMRRYLMLFAQEMRTLTVTFENQSHPRDVTISPYRMHAADLFEAVVDAASGKRVTVNFTGGPAARDKKGNPLLMTPEKPLEAELYALLDQYVDEGNALRKAICELVRITVFVRVVYTQSAVINALEDLMAVKGLRG